MKNYYEILEVSQNASPEVIEKAYKTLVKKYHPDLQTNNKKDESEKKIKLINEAYDVLSDKEKRTSYNLELKNNFVTIEQYNLILSENIKLKNELNKLNSLRQSINYYNNIKNNIKNNETNFNKQNNFSTNYTYNKNINIKKENNITPLEKFKNILKNTLAFLITFIIIFLIFQIPFIKNMFFNLSGESGIVIFLIIILFLYFISKK